MFDILMMGAKSCFYNETQQNNDLLRKIRVVVLLGFLL